jgi:hypothetical protein
VTWKKFSCLTQIRRYLLERNRYRRRVTLSEGVKALQAHIGSTPPFSAHLRTVTDQARTPLSQPNRLIRTPWTYPQHPNTPHVFELQWKKSSNNNTKDVNETLLFRTLTDLSTPSRVAKARNHALDPWHLKNARGDRKRPHQDMRIPIASNSSPVLSLRLVTASSGDLPPH